MLSKCLLSNDLSNLIEYLWPTAFRPGSCHNCTWLLSEAEGRDGRKRWRKDWAFGKHLCRTLARATGESVTGDQIDDRLDVPACVPQQASQRLPVFRRGVS